MVSLKNISLGFATGDIKNLQLKDQTSTENDPPDATEKRMNQFHHVMLSPNQISESQYGTAFQVFSQFVNDIIRSTNYVGFKKLDRKTSRMVDGFCFSTLNVSDKFKSLSVIIKLVLARGYGQATVV